MRKKIIIFSAVLVAVAICLWLIFGYKIGLIPYNNVIKEVNTEIAGEIGVSEDFFIISGDINDRDFYENVEKFTPQKFKEHLQALYDEHSAKGGETEFFLFGNDDKYADENSKPIVGEETL